MELFIATPAYDEWVSIEHATSMLETGTYLAQAGIGVSHAVAPGNPFLDIARNELVEKFLQSDAQQLLFVDADVGWDAQAIRRLMAYPQLVVGGLVPKRDAENPASFHSNALTGRMSSEGLIESLELPTAFMRIRRALFEKLERPFFKIGHDPKAFGEDIYFCRRLAEAGESCWIDSDISFSHRGGRLWRGNFYDHALSTGLLKTKDAA